MPCVEAADPTLPCGALNLALAFSATFWLVLRGLSVLRFAGRSPLPDGGHKEEAGIRFFGGERSGDGLLRAAHPVPRDRRGWVGARAFPFFRRKPLAGIHPPRRAARDCPGKLPRWSGGRSYRSFTLIVRGVSSGGRREGRGLASRRRRPGGRRGPPGGARHLGAVLSAECRNSRRRPPGRRKRGRKPARFIAVASPSRLSGGHSLVATALRAQPQVRS